MTDMTSIRRNVHAPPSSEKSQDKEDQQPLRGGSEFKTLFNDKSNDESKCNKIIVILSGLAIFVIFLMFKTDSSGLRMFGSLRAGTPIKVASWNMAAINNNPFEYWLNMENNPKYDKLMNAVQIFIQNQGKRENLIKNVFTPSMFNDLVDKMTTIYKDQTAIEAVMKIYSKDFSKRKIISDFLTDGKLGKKRLASMPDRVTNTIPLLDGTFAYRPTVINCYQDKLPTLNSWWTKWQNFFFKEFIDTVKVGKTRPAEMLGRIPRAKYPELTEKEEEISIPLQTLTAAIFDAVLVYMLNKISAENKVDWEVIRSDICDNLNLRKNDRIMNIIEKSYLDRDIFTLQEVAGAFIEKLATDEEVISSKFHIIGPQKRSRSDQNSVILLSKERFPNGIDEDITSQLVFSDPKMIANGDITLVRATDRTGAKYVIGSFHGDTNGLASITLINGVNAAVKTNEYLILGLDANTYEKGIEGKKQGVTEFAKAYDEIGLDSCWGLEPNPQEYTTYNARTYLQPQLNKASSKEEIREKGDVNPKDFIIFKKGTFKTDKVQKDNTGDREYIEGMVFPTLTFPSDHGILSTDLE